MVSTALAKGEAPGLGAAGDDVGLGNGGGVLCEVGVQCAFDGGIAVVVGGAVTVRGGRGGLDVWPGV